MHAPSVETWGEIRSWLLAVGTFGTLSVAVFTVRQQTKDRGKDRQFERSRQAREVVLGQPQIRPAGRERQYWRDRWSITAVNNSGDAITHVVLTANVVLPLAQDSGRTVVPVLAAGAQTTVEVEVLRRFTGTDFVHPTDEDFEDLLVHPRLEFSDITGARWARDRTHRLIEAPPVDWELETLLTRLARLARRSSSRLRPPGS